MKLRPNLPLGTIISSYGVHLRTTANGLGALKDLPSPFLNVKTMTTYLSTLGSGTTLGLNRLQLSSSSTRLSTPWSLVGEILQVAIVLLKVVGQNDYLQSQILAKFKSIQRKMESSMTRLQAGFCHPIGNILATIKNGNTLA
jgi:hypothetical protein